MNRESLDRWCERGILCLVLFILVFSPAAMGAVRMQEFLVVQLLTTLSLLLWVVRVWVVERPKFILPPMIWGVLAFTGYAVVRYFNCDVEYIAREELFRVLIYASLFFLVLNNLHRKESTQIVGFTLFAVATLISFYALYQFVTGSEMVWIYKSGYKGRGTGTYICPNHLGGFLELLLPLAVAYAIVGRGKVLTKVLVGYAALAIATGIAVTVSRGSCIAAALSLAFLSALMFTQRAFRWHSVALLTVLITGGILVGTKTNFFRERFMRGVASGTVDLNIRMDMWDSAKRMWQDNLWTGVGPAQFNVRFREYRPATIQLQADRVHNDYLNTLADWGIVGAGIIAASFGLLGIGVIKTWKYVQRGDRDFSSNQSDKFAFVLGASCGLFALAMHSFVDFNMHIPANAILAVTLMALITSHWRFATERFWFSARLPGKIIATFAIIAMLTCLGLQEWRMGQEWYLLRQASSAAENSPEKAALLERAYNVEPHNPDTPVLIGEINALNAFEGKDGYEVSATNAIAWYQRAITNNPHSSHNYLRWGMVQDFLLKHKEAELLFTRADELDPNGYYTCAYVGRHFLESGQLAAARPWLERSLYLYRIDNVVADTNLKITNARLIEAANDPLIRRLRQQDTGQ